MIELKAIVVLKADGTRKRVNIKIIPHQVVLNGKRGVLNGKRGVMGVVNSQ